MGKAGEKRRIPTEAQRLTLMVLTHGPCSPVYFHGATVEALLDRGWACVREVWSAGVRTGKSLEITEAGRVALGPL